MGDQTGTREFIQGRRGIWENTQALGHRVCGRDSRVVGRAQACFEIIPSLSGDPANPQEPPPPHPRHSTWPAPSGLSHSLPRRVCGVTLRELREFSGVTLEKGREECFQLSNVKAEGVYS